MFPSGWNSIGREPAQPALPDSTQADVCIIGAGYTGLWTACYLKKAAPQLLLQIVESISFVLVTKNVDTSGSTETLLRNMSVSMS